jgi:hypothetical protein
MLGRLNRATPAYTGWIPVSRLLPGRSSRGVVDPVIGPGGRRKGRQVDMKPL